MSKPSSLRCSENSTCKSTVVVKESTHIQNSSPVFEVLECAMKAHADGSRTAVTLKVYLFV